MTLMEQLRDQVADLKELRLTEDPQAYCSKLSDLIDALKGNNNTI